MGAPMRRGLRTLIGLRALLLCVLLGMGAPAMAQAADPAYPALSGRIVDAADLLSPADEAALEARLAAWEASSSDQIVIATIVTLGDRDIETYANGLFRHWQLGVARDVGGRRLDNGVLLLVARDDRALRIEVGYGLEGTLTDALSSQIIRGEITPRFRDGDFAGGLGAGADAIIAILSGDAAEWADRQARAGARPMAEGEDGIPWPLVLLIIFVVLVILSSQGSREGIIFDSDPMIGPQRRRGPPVIIVPGSWGGGGSRRGSGGGGFSGRGGSSGGGGASGRW